MIAQESVALVQGQKVRTVMSYDDADPYAVTFTFCDINTDDSIGWTFGRDLLHEVFEKGTAGEGDVRLAKVHDQIVLTLSTNLTAVIALPQADVLEFVDMTQVLVTPGDEMSHVNIDKEISGLIDG